VIKPVDPTLPPICAHRTFILLPLDHLASRPLASGALPVPRRTRQRSRMRLTTRPPFRSLNIECLEAFLPGPVRRGSSRSGDFPLRSGLICVQGTSWSLILSNSPLPPSGSWELPGNSDPLLPHFFPSLSSLRPCSLIPALISSAIQRKLRACWLHLLHEPPFSGWSLSPLLALSEVYSFTCTTFPA